MRKEPESGIFKFILNDEQTMDNLDKLRMADYDRFEIQELSRADQHEKLIQLIDKNVFDIPLMKLQIQEAFISAFDLRHLNIVTYFLQNGLDIDFVLDDSVISLCYSLEYLPGDPPLDLLKTILQYGADPRVAEQKECKTAIHVACEYGSLEVVKLLLNFGADMNAVDSSKKTPLNCAIENKREATATFLKSIKASEQWNS